MCDQKDIITLNSKGNPIRLRPVSVQPVDDFYRSPSRIRDFDGTPTVAHLLFRDQQGHVYPPQAKRLAPDFFFQQQIYRGDGEAVLLPPGDFTLEYGRGPEYLVGRRELTVACAEQPPGEIDLKRFEGETDADREVELVLTALEHRPMFGLVADAVKAVVGVEPDSGA